MKNIFYLGFLSSVLITTFLSCSSITEITNMNIMTFNIRYDAASDTANPWETRKDWVAQVIQYHDAEIIGVQEGLHHQVQALDELLPKYNWIGVGRDDGKEKGEYAPIFYDYSLFEVLDSGYFWLSETPDVPGSKSWDAVITRMVTWVKFKDKRNDKYFFVFNTHFDHIGQVARVNSATLIVEKIEALTDGELVILLGDFNITRDNIAYETITTSLKDTEYLSENGHYGTSYTYQGFKPFGEKNFTIDYIFINDEQQVAVKWHATLTDNWDGKYPSDHLPVLTNMEWKE